MIAGLSLGIALLLVAIAFVAGVGITTVGPGGVFLTVALFVLTGRDPAVVVGTASATFVATGIVGTATYLRSGELSSRTGRRTAVVLSGTGTVGALVGVRLNAFVPTAMFGLLLGGFVSIVGLLVGFQARRDSAETAESTAADGSGSNLLAAAVVGLFVGLAGGLLGIGGPVLAVPLLLTVGLPMLAAVAAAQVQSVFIAGFATAGYVARDAVSLPLAALVGVPELVGVVVGWRIAHAVDENRLKQVLAVLLVGLGPYIALST